jgi:hypothetical protein
VRVCIAVNNLPKVPIRCPASGEQFLAILFRSHVVLGWSDGMSDVIITRWKAGLQTISGTVIRVPKYG